MKNRIGTIAKKELARFFGDKRVALTTLLLPGILIYVLYTFMGSALSNMYSVDDAYAFRLSAVNLPASIQSAAEAGGLSFSPIGAGPGGQRPSRNWRTKSWISVRYSRRISTKL